MSPQSFSFNGGNGDEKTRDEKCYSNLTLRVFHLCLKVKKLNGSKSHFMVPDAKRFNHVDFEAGRT